MSDNPVTEDLEMDYSNSSEDTEVKKNAVAEIAAAIETILSEEHQDQKTNITSDNEIGLVGIDVLQATMQENFDYQYPALMALKQSKQEHVLSVGGYRSNQIADILKSLQASVISSDIPTTVGRKLLGR
jgi:hypothetical protein